MSADNTPVNPYAFVHTDWNQSPERKTPDWHDQFIAGNHSGSMDFQLICHTALFIPGTKSSENEKANLEFCYKVIDGKKHYLVPGSSLKGLIRSVVETIGNGCYSQFSGKYIIKERRAGGRRKQVYAADRLPGAFKACSDIQRLCVGCRLFGFMAYKKSYKGNVFFSDALLDEVNSPDLKKYTISSMYSPDPTSNRLYMDENGKRIKGRKFFYHHRHALEINGKAEEKKLAMQPGTQFRFHVDFQNLNQDDFNTLLYALVLEKGMWHKIGTGKPYGFGSVELQCLQLELFSPAKRYTAAADQPVLYKGNDLQKFIAVQQEHFISRKSAPQALEELKTIWSNSIPAGRTFVYDTLWNKQNRMGRETGRRDSGHKHQGRFRQQDEDRTFEF